MEQIGTVKQAEGDKARIVVRRASACGENCAHCKGGCAPTTVETEAKNTAGARTGDVVKIETDTKAVVRAALVLYFVPCVLAICGAVLASNFFHSTAAAAAVFAVLFFASFAVINRLDKKLAPTPEIIKIIHRKTD